MTPAGPRRIAGRPTGAGPWRRRVAAQVAVPPTRVSGVALGFALPPASWVDVDTLAENTLAGLRDAGVLPPRLAGLDAVIATKRTATEPSATVEFVPADTLRRRRPPGNPVCDVAWDRTPRAADRSAKRAWRARIAEQWLGRDPLGGDVWADVALGVTGSLLGPLEVVVDALEPVLGRDPRGRPWQEFFPNDDRIVWLRVHRVTAPGVRLRIGPVRPR